MLRRFVVLAFPVATAFVRSRLLCSTFLVRSSGLKPLGARSYSVPFLSRCVSASGDEISSEFNRFLSSRSSAALPSRASGRRLVAMATNLQAEEPSGVEKVAGKTGSEAGRAGDNDDAKYGFTRSEMHSKPLVGSVDLYERHVFLCHNTPENWPAKVESPDYDPLPSKFANALRSKKNELPKKVCRCPLFSRFLENTNLKASSLT